MNVRTTSKILAAAILMILMTFSANTFAQQGYGRQGKGMRYEEGNCGSPGWGHHERQRGFGRGFRGNLSDETIEKANKERDSFFEETGELRRRIRQKKLELSSELAKETPDAERAGQIQKEISKLKADFDEQRLAHRLRMKEIHPDLDQGHGFGFKGVKGHRGFAGGPCWN